MSKKHQGAAPLAIWNKQGKFEKLDGTSFIPLGGIYANFICIDWAGIEPGQTRLSSMSPFGGGGRIIEFQDATDAQLRQWLRWLRGESMNYLRMFCRGEMGQNQDPLDVCGKVNMPLWEKTRHFMDLCYQEGIAIHFVIVPEPRCSVYMSHGVTRERALKCYTAQEISKLPEHRRRFLDLNEPRLTFDRFFTDRDALQCHLDYLNELATLLRGHPALMCIEVYNEQQWTNHFYWRAHNKEVKWTATLVQHLHKLFPGVPVTCSFAGFGVAAQDPLLWIDAIPMDFFSPHAYQGLTGVSDRVDFAIMLDMVMNYSQGERPTMFGECSPGHFPGGHRAVEARLLVRDLAWFALLNNCPGLGMWQDMGHGEFDIPRKVMESIDFAHFRPARPTIMGDMSRHVKFFHALERRPSKRCHLPEDVWCPHRGHVGRNGRIEEEDHEAEHRYCVKMASRELAELHEFARFAISNGISYGLTRHPKKAGKTWDLRHIGTHHLPDLYRPFVPPRGYHVKYLSSADGGVHVVYLRNFVYQKIGKDAGRRKGEPAAVAQQIALKDEGTFDVEVWNLDTKVMTTRTCQAKDTIALGVTNDDYVLVLRKR